MRHRLYYFLPDMESVKRTFDDMLLNRIEARHVSFISNGTPLPDDIPEASFLLKTDVLHGAAAGSIGGAILGMAFGGVLIEFYGMGSATVLLTTFVGILFGGWASSMAAAAIPNTQLKAFNPALESGKILMIANIPSRRVAEIEKMLATRHPEVRFNGEEPHVPVFP